ncbi:MAG: sugar phosphate isomerase/epimerase [Pseudomonadota bacterium]
MKDLAYQLYSARHIPLQEALPMVAAAGFTQVEGYRATVEDPQLLQKLLVDNGLSIVSLHVGYDELKNNMQETLALARELDINHLVCPYLAAEQRPDSKEGWSKIAAELADFNAQISSVGRDFAWHNHDFEFVRLADGSLPIRTMLDEAPDMHWEIDIGWIARVGQDPMSWMRTYLDRISAVHLKDVAKEGECEDEDGWADVGHGTVDWPAVTQELVNSDCELFIVEHDNPSDIQRFTQRSFEAVSRWNLA